MGSSPVYNLPWPELPSQADGPAAFQSLATKLDTTLAGLVVPFTAVLPDMVVAGGTNSITPPITTVPVGRPVLMFAYGNMRIASSSGQFGVAQIQEASVVVTNSTAVQLFAGAGGSIVTPVMLVACRTFATAPTIVVAAGGSTDVVRLTEVRVTGFGFGWPS